MFKGRLVAIALAVGTCVASSANAFAQADQSGYARVNGLEMYYEITAPAGRSCSCTAR
jgi:outer membrane lipoprotein-sorting protein